uniref:G domain-containing protein n=1 Tax=Astyanax mexicanus TaxID=7994 RepID=W5KKM9_ASTMX
FFWAPSESLSDPMFRNVKSFEISSEGVEEFRFLLQGPAGAGKSSIINTIKTVFEGHHYINCLTASALTGDSFTTKFEKFTIGQFAFYDMMGLEQGEYKGVHPDDIISAVKGHVPEDYIFKPNAPIDKFNTEYINEPTLNSQIHCLVSVIPADKITMIEDDVIDKMKNIRKAASEIGIPQVLFMTRVDQVCKMTQRDITKIYQSKKIKEKIDECSNRLGVPLNCIFPVKNYSEENKPNEKLNCLMLEALTQIVYSANDYLKKNSKKNSNTEKKLEVVSC